MTDPAVPPRTDDGDVLNRWLLSLATELGISPDDVDIAEVLDLAKIAAHSVARPAAPVTTFLAGLAAGRAGGTRADIQATIRAASALTSASDQ
jgi:hypothetical protein